MKRVWAISDTHGMHGQLQVPEGIDLVIFAGDCSNNRNRAINANEVANFLYWFNYLDIKHKILISGNHDTSIEAGMHGLGKLDGTYRSIIYLEHSNFNIDGLNIMGSPYTPTFGDGWSFNKNRGKLDPYWEQIPKNLDILITHGPPKSILDLSENRDCELELCGDTALYNRVMEKKPKVHIFGHIHNFKYCKNQGIREFNGIKFINASCVEDGKFNYGLTSNGVIFEI